MYEYFFTLIYLFFQFFSLFIFIYLSIYVFIDLYFLFFTCHLMLVIRVLDRKDAAAWKSG